MILTLFNWLIVAICLLYFFLIQKTKQWDFVKKRPGLFFLVLVITIVNLYFAIKDTY